MDCDPPTFLLPDQAPEAVHEVAFWLVQMSEDDPPADTVLGLACRVTTGAADTTLTVADCEAEPPGPVQVISNSVLLESGAVDHVPLTAMPPFQPPLARHWVARAAFHVRVEVPRSFTVVGEAVRVIDGAGTLVTVTCRDSVEDPPLPVQVRV